MPKERSSWNSLDNGGRENNTEKFSSQNRIDPKVIGEPDIKSNGEKINR